MLQIANVSDGDIVLDFFSGSGTTAHATMQLNAIDGGTRKHIQIQLPEPTESKSEAYRNGYRTVADIAKERIRRAGEKIKLDYADSIKERTNSLDIGFKVFKLADSNFTKWHTESETDKDSLQQHLLDIRESSNDAASEDDLLTEVLLKQGISLTTAHAHSEVDGLSIWTVGDNLIVAYLNEHTKPTLDQLRAVAAKEPAKFIILEDAFKGDDELKTNLVQICKTNKIELWTV
jgi:adenine-specific DNA-methyltransferase